VACPARIPGRLAAGWRGGGARPHVHLAMTADLSGLTAEQIEALRLVGENLSSKEIARLLGISKSAVDQRLDRARLALGASSRREAARLLAGQLACDRIPCDPPTIADLTPPQPWMAPAEAIGLAAPQRVQETRSVFEGEQRTAQPDLLALLKGMKPYELRTGYRIVSTLLIAVGMPMLLGGLSMWLYGVVAITRLFIR
jgi:DNA-binding CsgD family transcriptional regulator